jgi:hypothetical protein
MAARCIIPDEDRRSEEMDPGRALPFRPLPLAALGLDDRWCSLDGTAARAAMHVIPDAVRRAALLRRSGDRGTGKTPLPDGGPGSRMRWAG